MLHQILCALTGKTGSIIKRYNDQISVDPSVSYLSRQEIQLINEICRCGFYYQKIMALINTEISQSSPIFSITKTPSMYRKAMYQGLKNAMNEYVELVLAIEQQFLKNRHFTFANLRAQLQPYQLIMQQISQMIYEIYNKNLRGGNVVNYLFNKYKNININTKRWLQKMLKSTIKVFINQVSLWILYGQIQDLYGEFFVHRVLTEASQKFKFKSKSSRHIEITDWDMFTLEQYMLPHALIEIQTAGKILFIGKSVKILKSANKISSIPEDLLLNKINQKIGDQYSQIVFEGVIEEIRQIIARKMIEFIMKQQNLMKQLEKLNSYYLMFKGDFYHHLFEEAKGIETIAQKEKAQKKINDVYLNNTFIRLGEVEDMKRLQFQIKHLGFSFPTFKNFINLCPVGNIDLLEGKSIRFNSIGSALWNRSKHNIENNFTMIFSLSFKKIKQMQTESKTEKSKEPTYFNLVIQNCKQVSNTLYQNPSYLNRINQYIALKIGFQYSQKEKNYVSSMLLVVRDIRNNDKEILLGICSPKGINFLDQNSYGVKLHYSNDTIKAQITGSNGQRGEIKVEDIKLGNYIQFQMGRAHLGFISTINENDCFIDLQQWQMICKPASFYNSHWSDLSLNFKIDWPINLILSQDLIESYSRIHKFLFPIRQLQIQLESVWHQIPKLIKAQKRATKEEIEELRKFQRKLAALRSQMQLVINNFWSYLQSDIAQNLWDKLISALQIEKDFQYVIKSVNKYVKSIEIMYYFNIPKIQRKINELIQKVRSFTIFFKNLQNHNCIDEMAYEQLQRIDQEFDEKLKEFHTLIKDLSKFNSAQYIYHLNRRLEGCLNPQKTPISS